MNLIVLLFCTTLLYEISAIIVDSPGFNKTKRTLVDTANYGEKPTPIFYATIPDGTRPEFFATTKTFALAKPPLAPVFDPEVPKQVAAQQVLYEYQQTPTNSVSNVHVKQLFQPLESTDANAQVQTSETVVNPVQHSSLINHGQNYAHVQLQPYFPQHTQTQHYVPGKFFYVNGKYVYPPYHHQTVAKPAVSYVTYGNPSVPKQKLTPPPTGNPMNYNNKFVPPQKQDMQQITKPIPSARVHEEVDEDEASVEKEEERNEELEEDDDDKSNYEEGSDEDRDHYRYHEDDDEDHGYYKDEREEEEEDDSDRRDSRVVKVHKSPKSKKNANKKSHNDKNNYSWSESFSHSSKYENGKKKSDKKKENKKYDTNKKKGGKRRNKLRKGNDRLEGRYSYNIPVIQEHNVFREKWYLSKSKKPEKKL